MALAIGIDVGTTAIKAAAYDRRGATVATAEVPSTVIRSAVGVAEQDPAAVWAATASCLQQLTAQLDAAEIGSVGLCAQGDGFWPLDDNGQPVRNAILWSDTRSDIAADLAALNAAGALQVVGQGCHTALWPGTSALGWRWLREHEPQAASMVGHVVTCGDWIGVQLTGQIATDFANGSIPFLDLQSRTYGASVAALGCDDIAERLPVPRLATETLGQITAAAATETGLPEGTPVSVATLDIAAMVVGLGLSDVGDAMMILGTTAVVTLLQDKVKDRPEPLAAAALHATNDVIMRILAPSTGAAAFDWFASLHPQSLGGTSAQEVADKLNLLVEDVPPGANGVTFLPYLNGERAPFVDPSIRAAFLGMSASTTKSELGRAVMEGTAYSLRHCFEVEGGLPTAPVHLTGGGARNPVWCQIIADVIGQDVMVNAESDLGLWGAACIGRAAVTGEDAIRLTNRDHAITHYAANAAKHAAYHAPYARYAVLSEALQALPQEGSV